MSDIGKVIPDRPAIPPVPKDRPVGEREHEERERRRKEREQESDELPDEDEDDDEGIDVYV